MDYLFHLLTLIAIYSALSISLNLLLGYTGLFSLATAAFFGLGAYTAALLVLRLDWGAAPAAAAAIAIPAIAGILLAIPTLRLGGDYFILAVLAFQMVFTGILNSWHQVTGGSGGLHGVRQPDFIVALEGFGLPPNLAYFILAGAAGFVVYLLIRQITHSPYGRVLQAIRQDAIVCQALGKNVASFKIATFGVSSFICGIAGTVYVFYFTAISPAVFNLDQSIAIVTAVIIGGLASVPGSILGAVILVLLPEALRLLPLPSTLMLQLPAIQQMLFGALLLAVMFIRPQGLLGAHRLE